MIPKRLYLGQPQGTETTLYTAPKDSILKQVILTNAGAENRTISISIVKSGQTAASNNRIIKELELASNETKMYHFTQVLHQGDFISAISQDINIVMSGVEL